MSVAELPTRPPRSRFALVLGVVMVLFTVLAARRIEFSLGGLIDGLGRRNAVAKGLTTIEWDEMLSRRSRSAFLETLQLAILGTTGGVILAMPLALWATRTGNPYRLPRAILRGFNNVIRAIPDLLWAGLFVLGVGIGALPGLLALTFFSLAVISKLTADVLDGIDQGPIEAAHASGARHTQMLRTAVVPQILPAYASFSLYAFELNLRASAVLGFVGAGGIGMRIDYFRNRGEIGNGWGHMWGIVFMFFLIVFLVERLSVALRRRLV